MKFYKFKFLKVWYLLIDVRTKQKYLFKLSVAIKKLTVGFPLCKWLPEHNPCIPFNCRHQSQTIGTSILFMNDLWQN